MRISLYTSENPECNCEPIESGQQEPERQRRQCFDRFRRVSRCRPEEPRFLGIGGLRQSRREHTSWFSLEARLCLGILAPRKQLKVEGCRRRQSVEKEVPEQPASRLRIGRRQPSYLRKKSLAAGRGRPPPIVLTAEIVARIRGGARWYGASCAAVLTGRRTYGAGRLGHFVFQRRQRSQLWRRAIFRSWPLRGYDPHPLWLSFWPGSFTCRALARRRRRPLAVRERGLQADARDRRSDDSPCRTSASAWGSVGTCQCMERGSRRT
jgi:hypothetical protein